MSVDAVAVNPAEPVGACHLLEMGERFESHLMPGLRIVDGREGLALLPEDEQLDPAIEQLLEMEELDLEALVGEVAAPWPRQRSEIRADIQMLGDCPEQESVWYHLFGSSEKGSNLFERYTRAGLLRFKEELDGLLDTLTGKRGQIEGKINEAKRRKEDTSGLRRLMQSIASRINRAKKYLARIGDRLRELDLEPTNA